VTDTKRIRVIDIETTGFDAQKDGVVEIAAYDLCLPLLQISRVDSMVVNPGRPIPVEASAVHHLTDVDVAEGIDFKAAWERIVAPADPQFTYFAAHNCDFERSFVPTPTGIEWIQQWRYGR
jgi:exodeoxyribonuclease X